MAYINHDVSTMAMPSGMNRMGQFPLDMSSVYYDKASLEAYAKSGAIAYVGQIVSLVDAEKGTVTVYSIQNIAGDLKEVGTKPVGDENTIVVAENGTISLAGIEDLAFERQVPVEGGEEGETKTETIQYQALLTKDGLVWVEPSKTTVEGLATLIDALTKRVDDAEDAIEALEDRIEALEGKEDKDTNTVTTITAADASLTIEDSNTEDGDYTYTAKVNISSEEGNSLSLKDDGLFVEVPEVVHPEYTISKEERDGYHGVYHLTKDGTNTGVEIAVPVTDLSEYAKTADVEDLVVEEIGKKVHFRTEIVETVPTVENAEAGVLYLVADENAESGAYIEYMLVGEGEALAVEKIGSTATDLSGYALKSELPTGKDAIVVTEGQGSKVSLIINNKIVTEDPTDDDKLSNVILSQDDKGLHAELAENIEVSGTVKAGALDIDGGKVIIDADGTHMLTYNGVGDEYASGYYGNRGIHLEGYSTGYTLDIDYNAYETLNKMSNYQHVKITAEELLLAEGSQLNEQDNSFIHDTEVLFHINRNDEETAQLQLGETVVTETELAQLNNELATKAELEPLATKAELEPLATTEALTEHEEYAEKTYAKKADVYTKDEIDEIIGEPGVPEVKDAEGNVTQEAKAGTGVYQHVYSKSEVTDLIADITGGESAADVKAELKEYKTTNDARVDDVESRLDTAEAKLSGIEAGAEANVIEIVKVNGTPLVPDGEKAVDITVPTSITNMGGYSELNERVAKNANDIVTLTNNLGTTNTNVSGLTTRIAALEAEVDESEKSRIDALEGVTAKHTIDIGVNTTAITTINTETLPALQQAITNEENARKAAIGAPSQGTAGEEDYVAATGVYAAIEAVESTIDFSPYAKKTEVASTYATIAAVEAIYKPAVGETAASGILATLIGADAGKSARAIAQEEVAALVGEAPETLDTIHEIAAWIENDKSGAAAMAAEIGEHSKILAGFGGDDQPATVIAAITAAKEEAITAASYTLPVATVAALGGIKSAADIDSKPAVNKVYVDEKTGLGEVKAISTDAIVQGDIELVLNGGNATLSK